MAKITVNPRIKQVKIVLMGESFSLESVPKSSRSWKEVVQVEHIPPVEYEGSEGC